MAEAGKVWDHWFAAAGKRRRKVLPGDPAKLSALASLLRAQIRVQDHAVDRVASVVRRVELGLSHPRRPRGSLLLVGPTGVGKTELTNVFTLLTFDGAKPIRFDMSECQTPLSVEKLIGLQTIDPARSALFVIGNSIENSDRRETALSPEQLKVQTGLKL